MPFTNLPQMFFTRAADLSTRPRYRYRAGDAWREVTWAETEARVLAIAAALLDDGVRVGDRVAILSATRPEWMEIDLAILACGALTIPIYQSSLIAECGYIIANSESSVALVENAKQRAKIDELTAHGFELDRAAGRVPRHRRRHHDGVCAQHRHAGGGHGGGASASRARRAAHLREGVRADPGGARCRAAAEARALRLGRGCRPGPEPLRAGAAPGAARHAAPGGHRTPAGVRKDPPAPRREHPVHDVRCGATRARDPRVLPRDWHSHPRGVRAHGNHAVAHRQPAGPVQVRHGRTAARLLRDPHRRGWR